MYKNKVGITYATMVDVLLNQKNKPSQTKPDKQTNKQNKHCNIWEQ